MHYHPRIHTLKALHHDRVPINELLQSCPSRHMRGNRMSDIVTRRSWDGIEMLCGDYFRHCKKFGVRLFEKRMFGGVADVLYLVGDVQLASVCVTAQAGSSPELTG